METGYVFLLSKVETNDILSTFTNKIDFFGTQKKMDKIHFFSN